MSIATLRVAVRRTFDVLLGSFRHRRAFADRRSRGRELSNETLFRCSRNDEKRRLENVDRPRNVGMAGRDRLKLRVVIVRSVVRHRSSHCRVARIGHSARARKSLFRRGDHFWIFDVLVDGIETCACRELMQRRS